VTYYHLTSVTRNARLQPGGFDVVALPRSDWRRGQFVAATVTGDEVLPYEVELVDGRVGSAAPGDNIVGALGTRAATLQCVGDWTAIGDDGHMVSLSMAGVFGRCTSRSPFSRTPIPLQYRGHVCGPDGPLSMEQFALQAEPRDFDVPTVLIIGTSMDAGKTFAARKVIRSLANRGHRVAAAKLTGVARRRDVLSMLDAGATEVVDFIDAGLPSTVVPEDEYRRALEPLLWSMAAAEPEVAVVEAGASPLEPYNGDACVSRLRPHTRCVILCASDPYAAQGVMSAFGVVPDLITGRATSTEAAVQLAERLTGVPALNLLDPDTKPALWRLLSDRLGLAP